MILVSRNYNKKNHKTKNKYFHFIPHSHLIYSTGKGVPQGAMLGPSIFLFQVVWQVIAKISVVKMPIKIKHKNANKM